MYAEASADLGDTDQLLHEIRLFPLELGKLVDDDKQMGDRGLGLSVFVELGIGVDVVDAALIEQPLSAPVLGFNGNHGPCDLVSRKVGNRSHHMGQIHEQVGHTAALVVDQEEADVVRAEIDGQRQNVGLEGLRFTGACSARHQAVGSVIFFMDIQVTGRSARHVADKGSHGDISPVLAPSVHDAELLHAGHSEHFKEGDGIGNISADLHFAHLQVGEVAREIVQIPGKHSVKFNFLTSAFPHLEKSPESGFISYNALTGVGQFLVALRQEDQGDPQIGIPVGQVGVDQLSLQEGSILHKEDIVGLVDTPPARADPAPALLTSVPEDPGKSIEHIGDLALPGREIPHPSVLGPCVRKPAQEIPFLPARLIVSLSGEQKGHFHICIAVLGSNLGHQIIKNFIGPGFARTADNTDDIFLQKIDADRHVVEIAVTVPDQSGLFIQGIIHEGKALFGYIDLHLEGHVAHSDSVGQKVLVGAVSSPEQVLGLHLLGHTESSRGIHLAEGVRIVVVAVFDLFRAADQILAVGLKAVCLLLPHLLLVVIQIHQGPESSDQGRADRCDDTGVHKHTSGTAAHPGADNRHAAAHGHGNRHGQGGADRHQKVRLGSLALGGRLFNLHSFRVDGLHAAGRPVIQSPLIRDHLLLLRARRAPGHFRIACAFGIPGPPARRQAVPRTVRAFLRVFPGAAVGRAGFPGYEDRRVDRQGLLFTDGQYVSQINNVQSPDLDMVSKSELMAVFDTAVVDIYSVYTVEVHKKRVLSELPDHRHISADIFVSFVPVAVSDDIVFVAPDGHLRDFPQEKLPIAGEGCLLKAHNDGHPLPADVQSIVGAVDQLQILSFAGGIP